LILKEEYKNSNLDVIEKQIASFFKKIKVDGLSNGNVRKILNYDNEATIESIIKMSKEDFKKVPGFQEKMATKVSESIRHKLETEKLVNIMAATNIFGRGFSEKRLNDIMEAYPDILISKLSIEEKINKIKNVNGISIKTAKQFVENIQKFIEFLERIEMAYKLIENENKCQSIEEKEKSDKFHGKSFVLTGFRDEALQEYILQNGGKIANTITKSTYALIVKDNEYKQNTKTTQAEKKGIRIITKDEFK